MILQRVAGEPGVCARGMKAGVILDEVATLHRAHYGSFIYTDQLTTQVFGLGEEKKTLVAKREHAQWLEVRIDSPTTEMSR